MKPSFINSHKTRSGDISDCESDSYSSRDSWFLVVATGLGVHPVGVCLLHVERHRAAGGDTLGLNGRKR